MEIKFHIHIQLRYATQRLSVRSQSCATIITINFSNYPSPRHRKPCDFSPFSLPPQPLVTIDLLFVHTDLPILDISYKWSPTMYSLLCLASHTEHHVFKVHPHCNVSVFHSFLCLNNISLCKVVAFCFLFHSLMYIWVVSTFWLLWIILLQILMYKH